LIVIVIFKPNAAAIGIAGFRVQYFTPFPIISIYLEMSEYNHSYYGFILFVTGTFSANTSSYSFEQFHHLAVVFIIHFVDFPVLSSMGSQVPSGD